MWKQSWGYKEGWTICTGVFLTGIVLQFSLGKINPELFRFPVNLIFGALFLSGLLLFHLLSKKNKQLQWFAGHNAGITSLSALLFLIIIMGLTRQAPASLDLSQERGFLIRIGFQQMTQSWHFILMSLYFLWVLGLVVLRKLSNFKWKDAGFILNHTGLFIAFFAAILGSSDLQRLKMVVLLNEAEWRATNEKKEIVELPLAIELKSFTIEEYPSGKPKCFTSDVTVYTQSGEIKDALVEVNKPLSIAGWKIYQYSYDKTLGKWSRYSVFELVKDPWLPAVYTGILMMLAGTVFLFFSGLMFKFRHYRKLIALILFGIILFSFLIARIWLSPERTGTLVPALQSPWFVPHVVVYMLAYAVFGVAVIYALYLLIKPDKTERKTQSMSLCDSLVYVGTAFLTMGMLIGAIWAKEVWGHYWSWDPKEIWAAATWMGCFIYIHFRIHRPEKMKTAIYLLIFSFLLLQICWIGVKYLPAAQGNSVHVY